jgi:hypothetical protein
MIEERSRKAIRLGVQLMTVVCCMAAFAWAAEFFAHLSCTPYHSIPQSFYGTFHETQEISGLVARDKSKEIYEHETEFVFSNRAERAGKMNFSFSWDAVEGFLEDEVTFDDPNVSCEIGPAGDTVEGNGTGGRGWRRLTVRCRDFDPAKTLTAKLRYPADAIVVRDTAPGYYRWDLDLYIEEDIPELDREIASFQNPYACANWIRKNIRYENISSDPQTAAETFRSGRGDCDDIAILFCYMMKRLFPETTPRVVEGWTVEGGYHANAAMRTRGGWLTLDPIAPSVRFGVFDFKPFVPSGRISPPFRITDAEGDEVEEDSLGISFGEGTVRML